MFDPRTPSGRHALDRLATDKIGWLTTVTPDGQPQTRPIWFLWEDGELLIYSDHRAQRNRNIRSNPRVAFHLGDDGTGGDIVLLEGEARVDPDTTPLPAHEAYLDKYGTWIREQLESPERMAEVYNVPIRVRPTETRAFGT